VLLLLEDIIIMDIYGNFNRSVILFKIEETTFLLAYHLVILVLQGPVFIIVGRGKHVRVQEHCATLLAHHEIVIMDAGQWLFVRISEEVFG